MENPTSPATIKPLIAIPDHVSAIWPEAAITNTWDYGSPWDDPGIPMPPEYWGVTRVHVCRIDGQWPIYLSGDDEFIAGVDMAFLVNVKESFSLPPGNWRPRGVDSFHGQLKTSNLLGYVEWNGPGADAIFVADGRLSAVIRRVYAKPLPAGVPYKQRHHTLGFEFTLFIDGMPTKVSQSVLVGRVDSLENEMDALRTEVKTLKLKVGSFEEHLPHLFGDHASGSGDIAVIDAQIAEILEKLEAAGGESALWDQANQLLQRRRLLVESLLSGTEES